MSQLTRTMQGMLARRSLSIGYVAAFTGRDESYVRRCFAEQRTPSLTTLWRYADAFTSCREWYRQTGKTTDDVYADLIAALMEDAEIDWVLNHEETTLLLGHPRLRLILDQAEADTD